MPGPGRPPRLRIRSIDVCLESLGIMAAAIPEVQFVPEHIRMDTDIHAAAEANALVAQEGIPFREAYQRIGANYRGASPRKKD